jgi:hypothetical protein
MSNGEWFVALFNREDEPKQRSINFAEELGLESGYVRDLWKHENPGQMNSYTEDIPAHGVTVLRVSETAQ